MFHPLALTLTQIFVFLSFPFFLSSFVFFYSTVFVWLLFLLSLTPSSLFPSFVSISLPLSPPPRCCCCCYAFRPLLPVPSLHFCFFPVCIFLLSLVRFLISCPRLHPRSITLISPLFVSASAYFLVLPPTHPASIASIFFLSYTFLFVS